ncbi:tetratricopeptide repeat protein [Sphingomonas sp. Root710]|uniref:tetratricopeptide repeat protein n=1 Tax=Sphingomonas sp. Root710 TaxID=1736594 RepID=UPI000B12C0E1|nr:tetratricopeptide repeat protein [Sphingomonas sp. Root710]
MLAGALLLALVGCGSAEQKAAKAAARFDAYYAKRDYYSAKVEIGKAIAAQDDNPEYWAKLARAQLGMGNYLDAHDAYSRVIELEPRNEEAIQALAELSYSGGSFGDSEKFADQILDEQPRSLRMLLVKGSIHASRRELPEARAVVDRMLSIDPSNEGAAILLARLLNIDGKRGAAIDTLEKSIARDGESSQKLLALLDLYAAGSDFRNTARIYARLFALKPGDRDLRLEYARALYDQGLPDRALGVLARLARRYPGDEALQQSIVDIWTEAGSAAVDLDRVRRFVAAQGDPQMKVALGHLLLDQKRYAEAEAVLRPFVDSLAPNAVITVANVEADVLYAGALSGLGRGGEALALIDRILKFDDGNPRALLMRVRVSVAANDLPRALRDAQALVRDNPDMVEGRVALAEIYVRRKERILADDVYAQAMNGIKEDPAMLNAYAAYMLRTGRPARALDAARRFTVDNPRSRDGWRERAQLCIQLGETDCVDEAFHILDQLPGGPKVRRELAAGWRRPVTPAKADAGQAAPTCGRTGTLC